MILAHHAPEQAIELAQCLVESTTEAAVWIHWDLNASTDVPEELAALAVADQRVRLVRHRVRCEWGKFGLVEAPINALREIRDSDFTPDVAILLSGSCLPCRPIAELERFLAERPGLDFIEDHDDSWMIDGWRSERWQYRHWFQHQRHPRLEHWSYMIQRGLRVKRSFPTNLEPRFGSQWWALTWSTVEAVLSEIVADPKAYTFFRTAWIPDETVMQSYVHKVGSPAGFNLTHFQFTDRGKPVVYYDDHLDYVPTLDSFFARKIAPQAHRLRRRLFALAREPDRGGDLDAIGTRRDDYAKAVLAQTNFPEPGHIYYRSQYADMPESVLARSQAPYVVLVGPAATTAKVAQRLVGGPFTVLGEIFRGDRIDLGGAVLPGIEEDATEVRDLDLSNFLVRVRRRTPGVPLIRWDPNDCADYLTVVQRDPAALVVLTDRPSESLRALSRFKAQPWFQELAAAVRTHLEVHA